MAMYTKLSLDYHNTTTLFTVRHETKCHGISRSTETQTWAGL